MDKRKLVSYLDSYLNIHEIKDVSLNGLVVDNDRDRVEKIGVAVDASYNAIKEAHQKGVDFLIVHHGFYWGSPLYIDLWLKKRLKALFEGDIALYVAHLPLDIHPEVGNNYGAMKLLEFNTLQPFGEYHGIKIGVEFELPNIYRKLDDFLKYLEKKLFPPRAVWRFGKDVVDRGVYCSGGCLSIVDEVKRAGIDLFITGEASHAYYKNARDMEINVVLLGHYASETIGVSLLGRHLKEQFGLEFEFVGEDSGL